MVTMEIVQTAIVSQNNALGIILAFITAFPIVFVFWSMDSMFHFSFSRCLCNNFCMSSVEASTYILSTFSVSCFSLSMDLLNPSSSSANNSITSSSFLYAIIGSVHSTIG